MFWSWYAAIYGYLLLYAAKVLPTVQEDSYLQEQCKHVGNAMPGGWKNTRCIWKSCLKELHYSKLVFAELAKQPGMTSSNSVKHQRSTTLCHQNLSHRTCSERNLPFDHRRWDGTPANSNQCISAISLWRLSTLVSAMIWNTDTAGQYHPFPLMFHPM